MKVAALQLCSQENVEQNLHEAGQLVEKAAAAGAELIVLPEGFSYLGPKAGKLAQAEVLGVGGPVSDRVAEWCRRFHVSIIAGGLPEKGPDALRPYNTSAVFDASGHLVARYRKLHLFDVELADGTHIRESESTARGDVPVVTEILGASVGLAICYDVRFPELFAWMAEQGAEVITVPAAFTRTTGKAHWEVLLRARAIETQCWVVAAAQEGSHPENRTTYGHAMIIDPWGEIASRHASPGLGFALADVDLAQVRSVRAQMPVAQHRVKAFSN